jgi:tripartite-type tricarboxylate transporter receptor subunit TctC
MPRGARNQYSYASTGLGSMNHLVAEDLKRQAGVELLHVPYAGGGRLCRPCWGTCRA